MKISIPVLLTILFVAFATAGAAEKPNVVWIVSEDNSIHYLRHYIEGGAETPHIEALAAHGLTFEHAFSNAPVCSVARTTLITGCYGPRIGTQYHRKYEMAAMPEGLRMFPTYLRDAGYYTTNNSKKDYNAVESKGVWDESSNKATWRNRGDKSQPFFHFQSHTQSHESSLHFNEESYQNDKTNHDPAKVTLAPYHPDTPLFRYTHARYLDNMQKIDAIVGETVAKLKEDGVLEDTFIFYFGDHGGVLPRGKGYPYESGLHVPLIVRVPENFAHLVDAKNGTRHEGFVSFIDFGPTVLNLAGLETPEQVDGRAFLGNGVSSEEVNARDEAFGYADRMDERYEFVRTLRKGKYFYMRFFQPYYPDGLNNNYRYKMLAFEEWRQLWKAGKLDGAPAQFFARKPAEALFDCETDPHNVTNLAGDPAHAAALSELRNGLSERLRGMPDLSYYPESYLVQHAMGNPIEFGQTNKSALHEMADLADLALKPFGEARSELESALTSGEWTHRYWAAMVCTSFGEEAASLTDKVKPLLKDESEAVRMRAAEFLGSIGAINPQDTLVPLINETGNPVLGTEALQSVVWFRDHFDGKYPVDRSDFDPAEDGDGVMRRLDYINGVPYPPKKAKPKKKSK
ncbi:MAG: sulfatase-like hydrolase/transferase [Verrucomicrobiota bacterium]